MAVTTYMDLIEQMKALADKINKHYDKVTTLETEIPIHYFPYETVVSVDHKPNQCFYADGSADSNTFTLRRSCGGKNYLYRIQMFSAAGLISKEQYNYSKSIWEDL